MKIRLRSQLSRLFEAAHAAVGAAHQEF